MREETKQAKKDGKDRLKDGNDEQKELTRRKFLSTAAAGGAAAALVPRHVLGRGFTPPSDLLNIAGVGVGGMGRQNLINLASQNIVALCDVDWGYADKGFERLDSDIEKLRDRLEHPDRAPAPHRVRVPPAARVRRHSHSGPASRLLHPTPLPPAAATGRKRRTVSRVR